MDTADTPGSTIEISPGTDDWGKRNRTTRLGDHFAEVSARYGTLRELDLGAVRIVSNVVARAADSGRPVRLVDVATGSGRYLDAVSHFLGPALAMEVVPIGLDLSPPMLTQARICNGHAGLRARHLVGAVETLPLRASSCDVMTCFNAVHHFDLARFAGEASRVLAPSGQLVVYTRTPEQNRRTIWGRHFPEFATRETRFTLVWPEMSYLVRSGWVIVLSFTAVAVPTMRRNGWRIPFRDLIAAPDRGVARFGAGLFASLILTHILLH